MSVIACLKQLALAQKSKPRAFLNFHDSVFLNGNACRMFEFLGKRLDGA